MRKLAETLQANSELGGMIHNLRVEGGYGQDLVTLVGQTPNVCALSLVVNTAKSKEEIRGLAHASLLLNPSRLYLHGLGEVCQWADSETAEAMKEAFTASLASWTSLVRSIHRFLFLKRSLNGARIAVTQEELCMSKDCPPAYTKLSFDTLQSSSAFKKISLCETDLLAYLMACNVLQINWPEIVVCRRTHGELVNHMKRLGVPEHVQNRVVYVNTGRYLARKSLYESCRILYAVTFTRGIPGWRDLRTGFHSTASRRGHLASAEKC